MNKSSGCSPLTKFLALPLINTSLPFFVGVSGGMAFNGVVEELKKLTTHVAHVLPVSDDGGSTSEIVRVLGTRIY